MKYLFTHAHLIVDGEREFFDASLLVEDERILEVYDSSDVFLSDVKTIDLKGLIVMPGSFDTHTHGINNINFDNAPIEEMDKASYLFAKEGTTSFIPSISYDCSLEEYVERSGFYNEYTGKYCRFQGFHIEGPFLSKKHLGVADPDKLLLPDMNMVGSILNTTDKLKQMTVAIELEGSKELCAYLKENDVRVMAGHSDALESDIDENVSGFTHLFNAMRGLHHRDRTLVNAAFTNRYYCELIADGNHVDRGVLELVIHNIDRNRIVLVSDSSTARGLPDGEYEFISKKCTKKGTKFISHDGHYAGSVVSINDEMKVLKELGASYKDLLLYSSLNAFRLYGLDKEYGTIEKDKYADFIIMDDNLNIKLVYVQGKFIKGE